MSTTLLIVRIALGVVLLLQGYAKLTPDGRRSTSEWFDQIGFRPAKPLAVLTGLVEVGTAALFLAGLATPLAVAGAVGLLAVAVSVNGGDNGYWNANGGAEYPLFMTVVVAALAFSGAGDASLDATLGWRAPSTELAVGTLVAGLVAAVPPMAHRRRTLRRRPAVAAAAAESVPASADLTRAA